MELAFVLAAIVGLAWVVLSHRSTMEHLRARRDGSLDRDAYKTGVRDGLLRAAKMIEADPHSTNHPEVLRASADE